MTNYAIVVGINVYPEEIDQPELHGAVADACDFADWVLSLDGGAVLPASLYFWTHPWPALADVTDALKPVLDAPTPFASAPDLVVPGPARAPSAREIFKTALNLAQQITDNGDDPADQRIYIFLAGHGVRSYEVGVNSPQTFFLAGDFTNVDSQYVEGVVACDTLRRSLLKRGFGEVFLFLDCCRVQDPILPVPALPLCVTTDESPTLPWGAGHAAQAGREAFEVPGNPARGAFSLVLVDALRHYRNPATQGLTICELRDEVVRTISTQPQQVPDFDFNPKNPGPAIFPALVAAPLLEPITLDLSALPAAASVRLTDGELNPVPGYDIIHAAAEPVVIPDRPKGIYKVQRLDVAGQPALLFEHPGAGVVHVG